jgi:NAD-dependent dihydropyrimidine dehydrogenase PreA subunit
MPSLDYNTEEKKTINKHHAKRIVAQGLVCGTHAVLDHKNFGTTQALINVGVKPDNIYIFEKDDHVLQHMFDNNIYGVNIIRGDIFDYIWDNDFSSINLDFCITNARHRIPKIIKHIWEMRTICVMTVTVANRGMSAKSRDSKVCQQVSKFIRAVSPYASVSSVYPYTGADGFSVMINYDVCIGFCEDPIEYRPHRVLKTRVRNDTTEYLVKWWGYTKNHTWMVYNPCV